MRFVHRQITKLIEHELSAVDTHDARSTVVERTYTNIFVPKQRRYSTKSIVLNASVIAMVILPGGGFISLGLLAFYPRFYDDTIIRLWFKKHD